MEEQLKQLAALFSKLPPEDQKRASELLKGVTPSNAPAPGGEKVDPPATTESSGTKTNISASPQSDAIKAGLTNPKIDAIELRAFADMEAARRSKSANRPMIQSSTRPNDPNDNKFRKEVYRELGISDPLSENRSAFDLNRLDAKAAAIGKSREEYESMPRLERMKLESAGAAAEQERRQGIRDSVALPFNSQFLKDKEKFEAPFKQQGLPAPGADRTGYEEGNRNIFKDAQGRLEDPATLKARLIKEGMNPNDATLAAGQRYRDMFAPPNAKKDGFGMQGGQASAVMAADPERRMDVMQQLKDARKDNLQALAEARRNNPFRKEVGVVTEVQSPDGTQLAKRVGQEDSVGVARGGIAGAIGSTVDGAGRMELTDAGRKAVENRTYTSKVDATGLTAKPGSEESLTAVAAKYGTAVGGKMNFPEALTDQQRLGQEPLSEVNQKYKDSVLANARGSALNNGKVDSTAATLMQIDPAAAAKSPIVANTPNKAKEEDTIKKGLMASNKDALDKAADEELKRRQQRKGVA